MDFSKQIEKNDYHTFFGGKNGYDLIVFDNHGKIVCSGGDADKLLQYARENNYAVAILIPVMFSKTLK